MVEHRGRVPPQRKDPGAWYGDEGWNPDAWDGDENVLPQWAKDQIAGRKARHAEEDLLDDIHDSKAYQRLKQKFTEGEIKVQSGIPGNSLTVGDLVDILDVYLQVTQSDPQGAFSSIEEIARAHTEPIHDTETESELDNLHEGTPETFKRDNPLYAISVDLQKVVDSELGELSHYPGGIRIRATHGKENSFHLFFPNLQKDDDGKPVKEVFEELGLPVISMIEK